MILLIECSYNKYITFSQTKKVLNVTIGARINIEKYRPKRSGPYRTRTCHLLIANEAL